MLNSAKELKGYKLNGIDGELGKVKEFYFDDEQWGIRYLVADTNNGLNDRRVLISAYSLLAVNRDEQNIGINLTKKQIQDSPSIEFDKPVSKQFEEQYQEHYGLPVYWDDEYRGGVTSDIVRDSGKKLKLSPYENSGDAHLRSTDEVGGYHIHAHDGEIGHIDDFIIDDETWGVRYLVVDTRKRGPGKKVLLSPFWIDNISWQEGNVFVKLARTAIKESPEYSSDLLTDREYEAKLFQHYNRRGYWVDEEYVSKYAAK